MSRRATVHITEEEDVALPTEDRPQARKKTVIESHGLDGAPSKSLRETEMRRKETAKRIERARASVAAEAAEERRKTPKSQIAPPPSEEPPEEEEEEEAPSEEEEEKEEGQEEKEKKEKEDKKEKEPTEEEPTEEGAKSPKRPSISGEKKPILPPPPVKPMPSVRRASQTDVKEKTARFMNTYRLESKNPFNAEKVEKILQEVLDPVLGKLTYDEEWAASKAKDLPGVIRTQIRHLKFDRYKIIVKVDIGEKKNQGSCTIANFLWDVGKDSYAAFTSSSDYMYLNAMVFGIYFD